MRASDVKNQILHVFPSLTGHLVWLAPAAIVPVNILGLTAQTKDQEGELITCVNIENVS